MTVKELIETNNLVTDVRIRVRKEGWLADEINIGLDAGVKPPYPSQIPVDEEHIKSPSSCHRKDATYIRKELNAWDKGKDYWQVLTGQIPKKYLDLQVSSWNTSKPYYAHHPRSSANPAFSSAEYLIIDAVFPESNVFLKIEEKKPEKVEQLEGQTSIEDFLEVL